MSGPEKCWRLQVGGYFLESGYWVPWYRDEKRRGAEELAKEIEAGGAFFLRRKFGRGEIRKMNNPHWVV